MLRHCLIALLILLGAAHVRAQDLSREQIDQQLTQLRGTSGDKAEPAAASAIETYGEALSYLDAAKNYDGQAKTFESALEAAPKETARLEAELARLQPPTPHNYMALNDDALSTTLEQFKSDSTSLRDDIKSVEESLIEIETREPASRDELLVAKSTLQATEDKLTQLPPPVDAPPDITAAHSALFAKKRALNAQIHMLNAERLSRDARQKRLLAQQTLLKRRLTFNEQKVQQAQAELNSRRSKEAATAEKKTALAQEKASATHPLLKPAASKNAELSQKLKDLADAQHTRTEDLKRMQSQLQTIERNYQRAVQQLQITTVDTTVGEYLRSQRVSLPDFHLYERQNLRTEHQLTETRLAHFRLQELAGELLEPTTAINDYLEAHSGEFAALPAEDQGRVLDELGQLLADRKSLQQQLDSAYSENIHLLDELVLTQKDLVERLQGYTTLLDENLLWIANADPISGPWFKRVTQSLTSLFSDQSWRTVPKEQLRLMKKHWGVSAVVTLVILGLFLIRPRLRRLLDMLSEDVGRVQRDRFSNTLFALLVTVLFASPWPLLMRFTGWLMKSSDIPLAAAFGTGLWYGAEVFFGLAFLRRLYIPRGLAEAHFGWGLRTRRVLRWNLRWLMPIFVLMSVAIGITESLSGGLYRDTIARLAFSIGLISLSFFAWRVLRRPAGVISTRSESGTSALAWRAHYLWPPIAIITPLVLTIVSAQGYFYTSLQVGYLLFKSTMVFVAAYLIYELAVRWLLVAQRRLALTRAREKRQTALDTRASREAAGQAGEIAAETIDVPQIGLDAIDIQTRKLIRVALYVAGSIILWFTWKEVTPSLGVLQEVKLWDHATLGGDGTQMVSVTLANIGIALLVLFVTFAAKRNIPGLLELAVLQPLSVEPGNRYAIISISRYAILTVGFLAAMNLLGIRWQELQWLVAAVGVGLGFGLKEIFANFISGLILLFERPVRVGDTVTIRDVSGVITRIRMRATVVTDWDNKELIIPNQNLITEPLVNWSLSDPVTRVRFKVGVAYGTDPSVAHRVILSTVAAHPLVLSDPAPRVLLMEFGESSLDFDVRVFVKELVQRLTLIHDLHIALEKTLRENNIEIPFPQRDVHVRTSAPEANPLATATLHKEAT